jgi:anti-sigma factor RsiW
MTDPTPEEIERVQAHLQQRQADRHNQMTLDANKRTEELRASLDALKGATVTAVEYEIYRTSDLFAGEATHVALTFSDGTRLTAYAGDSFGSTGSIGIYPAAP